MFDVVIRRVLHSGDNCVSLEADVGKDCETNEQSFNKTFTKSGLIPDINEVINNGEGTWFTVEGETKLHGVLDISIDGLELDDEAQGEDTTLGFEKWPIFTVLTAVEVGIELHNRLDDERQGTGTMCGVEPLLTTEGEIG